MSRTITANVREKMVTRTIQTLTVKVLIVDTQSRTMGEHEFTVPSGIDERKIPLYIKNAFLYDNEQCVSILDKTVHEELYGMTEGEFLEHARKLPPRSVKETE